MVIKLDEVKLKKILIKLYEDFIINPNNKEVLKMMDLIEQKYTCADDLIRNESIVKAINFAGDIEVAINGDVKNMFDGRSSLEVAKEVLDELRKN